MTYSRKETLKSVSAALVIGLGYILVGGLYIYFTTDWAQDTVKTMDDFAKVEKIKDIAFIILTGLVVLFLALLATFRINYYSSRVVKQQEALLENEQRATAGIFAASIAHDATNIITSLRFCIEMLGRNPGLCESSQDLVKTMKQALHDLSSLNKKLLECSKRDISDTLTSANIVEEAEKTLRLAKVNQRVIHCELHFEAPESLVFPMNVLLMSEMILNLALNAGDAITDKGNILVKISRTNEYAIIEVHDNGPSIPAEIREKIFDPFFTTKKTGTGLGLVTVKGCAEFHGGWAEVLDSPILGGALFRVWIPINCSLDQTEHFLEKNPESKAELSAVS